MITSLDITNFQSHSESHLEFSPHVNAIRGGSDQGKSAVLRALLWCITNSPSGDAYVSDWNKTPKGAIKAGARTAVGVFTNGFSVGRVRDSTFNGYKIFDGEDTQQFEALHTDVPKAVETAFNLGSVNIQRQMDPPFLISSTPGEAARFINSLVNLSDIDLTLSEASSLSRSCTGDLKSAGEETARAKALAESFGWLPNVQEMVQKLAGAKDQMTSLEKTIKNAQNLAEFRSLGKTRGNLQTALDQAGEWLEKGGTLKASIQTQGSRLNSISQTFSQWKSLPRVPDVSPVGAVLSQAESIQEKIRIQTQVAHTTPVSLHKTMASRLDSISKALKAGTILSKAEGLQESIQTQIQVAHTARASIYGAIRSQLTKISYASEQAQAVFVRIERMSRIIDNQQARVNSQSKELSDFSHSFHDLDCIREKLQSLGDQLKGQVCPVCGRPFDLSGSC